MYDLTKIYISKSKTKVLTFGKSREEGVGEVRAYDQKEEEVNGEEEVVSVGRLILEEGDHA